MDRVLRAADPRQGGAGRIGRVSPSLCGAAGFDLVLAAHWGGDRPRCRGEGVAGTRRQQIPATDEDPVSVAVGPVTGFHGGHAVEGERPCHVMPPTALGPLRAASAGRSRLPDRREPTRAGRARRHRAARSAAPPGPGRGCIPFHSLRTDRGSICGAHTRLNQKRQRASDALSSRRQSQRASGMGSSPTAELPGRSTGLVVAAPSFTLASGRRLDEEGGCARS